jgi:tetratricopeptide (TPR) repeat protein
MSAEQYLAESEKLTNEGNWDGAMIAIEQAIRLSPLSIHPYSKRNWLRNNLDILRNLAILEQTIQQLNISIRQDPSNPTLYFDRGKANYLHTILSGEPKKVKSLAAELAASGWNVQGDAGSIISLDMKDAIIDLDKSIKIDPDLAEAYHWRGLAHHMQALQYLGVTLYGVNSAEIRSAIEDYRQAIEKNPELAEAYNDLGTAYLHLYPQLGTGVVDTKKGETIESALEDIRNALQYYDKTIEHQPDHVNYYLNRARAFHLIALNSNVDSARKILQPWLDDANTAVELEPNQPWGYMMRAAAYLFFEKLSTNKTDQGNYHKNADEDWKIYSSKAGKRILENYEVKDILNRFATVSSGLPIMPVNLTSEGMLGKIDGEYYQSPSGKWRLKLPALMQPNSNLWDERSSQGNQVLYLSDDLGRYYALFLLPIEPDNPPSDEWILEQTIGDNKVLQELSFKVTAGQAKGYVYKDTDKKAKCAVAFVHRSENLVTAVYCLMDHYAGENDPNGGFRLFGKLYGIEYEPVEKVLEDLLTGLKLEF